MRTITVLGGTGALGARVADLLQEQGHQVRRAARSTGVDVSTGAGLAAALADAEVVVDCLNVVAMSRSTAVTFFAGAATRVSRAALQAGVGQLVLVSILNVTDPAARSLTGYYAGKAAQETVYADSGLPVTVAATTAWFSLAELFLTQLGAGPVAVVPRMRLAPVHPQSAAALVAKAASSPAPAGVRRLELAGPGEWTAPEMARRFAASEAARAGGAAHPPRVVPLPLPRRLTSVLLPGPEVPRDDRTFQDWLRDRD